MKTLKITKEEKFKVESEKYIQKKRLGNTKHREKKRQVHIKLIKKYFPNAKKIICIGARDDFEVLSFYPDYEPIGVDLVRETPYIKQYDAHKLDQYYDKNQFDVAYCSHSLEHMLDGNKVLSNIRKIASQGVVITLPCTGVLGKGHCTVYDIMEEAGENNLPEKLVGNKLKAFCEDRKDLLKDFKNIEPSELVFFTQRGWRGGKHLNPKKIKQKFTEFDMIFRWGE